MPLYDCMLLLKPNAKKELMLDLVVRIGKHICRRNGVVTDVKSFGDVKLGYGIKKLDGRYYQGKLLQMTMMAPPSFNSELYYLNKEDRLLRWLLVKHRDIKFGVDFLSRYDDDDESSSFRSSLYGDRESTEEDEEEEEDSDEDRSESKDEVRVSP